MRWTFSICSFSSLLHPSLFLWPLRLTFRNCVLGPPCPSLLTRLRYGETLTVDLRSVEKGGGYFPYNSLPAGHRLKATSFLHQRLQCWDVRYPPAIATGLWVPKQAPFPGIFRSRGGLGLPLLLTLGIHHLLISFNPSHILENSLFIKL